jgi:hypothetical protein
MCYTPPSLITVHFDLVQHFIEDTVLQLTTGHCSIKADILQSYKTILKIRLSVFTFTICVPLLLMFAHLLHVPTYWPSLGVQVVLLRKLLFCFLCCYVCTAAMHVFGLWFCWLKFLGLVCGSLRYFSFCWSRSTLLGGQPSWLFMVVWGEASMQRGTSANR